MWENEDTAIEEAKSILYWLYHTLKMVESEFKTTQNAVSQEVEVCKGCGRRVPHTQFVWSADSEGYCLNCAKERGRVVKGDDGLLYLVRE